MNLKSIIDTELARQNKTFKWLVGEVGISNDGLKAGLETESIKLRDFKKVISVLNMPIQSFFEQNKTIQKITGDNNLQANHSMVAEPAIRYKVESLEQQIVQLKSQLNDKDEIIQLLRMKN